ncbi:hypothetical protein GGP41_006602 [Bipolaris sorokiniana]|uniref:Uncharacterized protein n=1 Tax=Cochliobolus sativus TaxID=45130 RepID=A0A8H6E0S6_COCSA|nr:hypothetical protein GGP41_006602 [Bipolaris sorokiniana]
MMHFNLANCILCPILEAILTVKLFPNDNNVYVLTRHVVFFTLLNNSILVFYNLVLYPFFLSPLRSLAQAKGFIPLIGHSWM